jgi:hypothetical protein
MKAILLYRVAFLVVLLPALKGPKGLNASLPPNYSVTLHLRYPSC